MERMEVEEPVRAGGESVGFLAGLYGVDLRRVELVGMTVSWSIAEKVGSRMKGSGLLYLPMVKAAN